MPERGEARVEEVAPAERARGDGEARSHLAREPQHGEDAAVLLPVVRCLLVRVAPSGQLAPSTAELREAVHAEPARDPAELRDGAGAPRAVVLARQLHERGAGHGLSVVELVGEIALRHLPSRCHEQAERSDGGDGVCRERVSAERAPGGLGRDVAHLAPPRHDVHRAAEGARAELRTGGAAHDLDARDPLARDRREIHAAAGAAERQPVEQHLHAVRRDAADRDRGELAERAVAGHRRRPARSRGARRRPSPRPRTARPRPPSPRRSDPSRPPRAARGPRPRGAPRAARRRPAPRSARPEPVEGRATRSGRRARPARGRARARVRERGCAPMSGKSGPKPSGLLRTRSNLRPPRTAGPRTMRDLLGGRSPGFRAAEGRSARCLHLPTARHPRQWRLPRHLHPATVAGPRRTSTGFPVPPSR